MSKPGRYPPPNFSCPTREPVLRPSTLQWSSQQRSEKFQASEDWSWIQAAPRAHWNPCSTATFSRYSPNDGQHRNPGPYHHKNRNGQQGDGQNQWGKKKKRKESQLSFFCDTCDRGFKNQTMCEEHVAQHVKCSVDDCTFTANEKLVQIHWKNNHAPGAKQIKLDTPEEIAKWREERRNNYPTLSNVEKKMKIMEAKVKRGDVLETAQFGHFKSRGCGGQFQNQSRGANSGHQRFHQENSERQPQAFPCSHQDEDPLGVLANCDPDSDQEEPLKETKVAVSVAPKSMTSALGSLMSSYGGDMTESEEEVADTPLLKTALALEENKAYLADHFIPAQNSAPKLKKRPTIRESETNYQGPYPFSGLSTNGRGEGKGGQGRRSNRRGIGPHSGLQKHHPTLLEMLLASDIRHERNIVLQCIRFIVCKGFFELACNNCNAMLPETAAVNKNCLTTDND
ncbi:FMR1-interacting protein NUFIP1 isoform X2 [Salminus brasiliensis]|uniref:FMR1-interacting protein NUFIP1 isoform X2 n=1 Tax=Salminus brasiliensis TaxID=930266 RepID=UPI003B83A485